MRFVDLGLPSGTLWADCDVEKSAMEGCSLPTYEQAQELVECCDFLTGTSTDGRKYYIARGPSGQSIRFPIGEYEGTPGPSACCWCSGEEPDSEYGFFLLISEITITIGAGLRRMGYPYRMVKASK